MTSAAPRVLSLIPPMTQLNTPYPSTAYLTGFLRSRGVFATQHDLALELVLWLLSEPGLAAVYAQVQALPVHDRSPLLQGFCEHWPEYRSTIGPVVRFLQGQDSTLAHRICSRSFLPEGPRFAALDSFGPGDEGEEGEEGHAACADGNDDPHGDAMAWAFGTLGINDRARHLATMYLNDLADVVKAGIDPRF